MLRLRNTDCVTCILRRFYCIFLILNGVFLSGQCTNYNSVHGERYIGPVVSMVTMVGLQQCVRECLSRPAVCGGVSYRRAHFLCEIVTSIDRTEPVMGYVRIRLNDVTQGQSLSNSSLAGEKCVRLSSHQTYCVRDNYQPTDCTAIYKMESSLPSGLYQINLPVIGDVTVFCEMEIDGGGWTVFQRRVDGSEDFYRTWTEYKNGFGNMSAEFWLGNDKLHYLLSQGRYEFRVDMGDFNNQTRYVKYTNITVGDEASKYVITLNGFSGNTGDCFTSVMSISNIKFSTKDQDNDVYGGHCAVKFPSGWWHKSCHCSNPNGLYLAGETTTFANGITYEPWLTHYYSLKAIQLMVRKKV